MSKIIGVTVGTQLPKPNFKQTDPTKGDYIKNKPDFEGLKSRVTAAEEELAQKQPIGDYALKSEIPESTPAIIDVVELPTENINEGVFYRLATAKFVSTSYSAIDDWTCHYVNELPSVGEPVSTDMVNITAYYNAQDGEVYGYADDMISAAGGVPVGWYPIGVLGQAFNVAWGGVITDDEQVDDSAKVLLTKDFYIYQDGWCKVPFAYEKAPEFDIQWDGDMTGRIALDMSMLGYDQGVYFVKVSDEVFTTDDLINWNMKVQFNDYADEYTIDEYSFDTTTYPGAFTINNYIVVLHDADILAAALGIPTGIYTNGVYFWLYTEDGYVSRLVSQPKIVKIDEKYLPDMDSGVGKNVAGQEFEVDGGIVFASKGAEIFNDYANNKATGQYSHAEGTSSYAEGYSSHAEGYSSHAEGYSSHAEGYSSHAEGVYSHAEGGSTHAQGNYSHAEGSSSYAEGHSSHAEGHSSHAEGVYSHTEGDNTHAEGDNSHAEGRNTHAVGLSQHVQGEFNLVDPEYNPDIPYTRAKYAHIVGNGTATSRSNAHTLDWSGNAWFQGDVYVGGTGQDDETAERLAKMSDVNVFVAKVNETTYDEVLEAYNAGKVCMAVQGTRTFELTSLDEECCYFKGLKYDINNDEWMPIGFCVYTTKVYGQYWVSDGGVTSSHLANRGYVDTAIASLVNSAPEALNTLDELAAALGDDENFATTVTNQIASKQDAITGTAGQFVVIGADGKPTTKTIPYAEEATF